ncbi:MAG: urease accessory protein UreE [Xenococcus sp. (in: cyanobacteria)]
MKEIVQKYLGNIAEDSNLEKRIKVARETNCYLEVALQHSELMKGRILTKTSSGAEIGIIKSRDLVLRSGDIFETETGNLLLIKIAAEKLMVLSFEQSLNNNYAMDLVSLGHILGNHHYPIKIDQNKIYVRLITDAKVIVKMIAELKIPGLKITFETNNGQEIPDLSHTH